MVNDIQGDELLQLISLGPDAPGGQFLIAANDEMVELVSYGASKGPSIAGANGVDDTMTELTLPLVMDR